MRSKLVETTEVKVLLNTLQGINYTYLFFRISFQIGLMFELLMFECLRAISMFLWDHFTLTFSILWHRLMGWKHNRIRKFILLAWNIRLQARVLSIVYAVSKWIIIKQLLENTSTFMNIIFWLRFHEIWQFSISYYTIKTCKLNEI